MLVPRYVTTIGEVVDAPSAEERVKYPEFLDMARLDNGDIQLFNYDADVMVIFPVSVFGQYGSVFDPGAEQAARQWADKRGYIVDTLSHWSLQKHRAEVSKLCAELAYGKLY